MAKKKDNTTSIGFEETILWSADKLRVRNYERMNVMQSLRFSDMMNRALSNYLNGMLTNEEVIDELLQIARAMRQKEQQCSRRADDEGNLTVNIKIDNNFNGQINNLTINNP